MSFETTWPGLLTRLVAGQDLSRAETDWAMNRILGGDVTPTQIAAFMVALRAKGETPEELAGLARVMSDRATPIEISQEAVDVVGSGGDRANTVNISTMAAIVTAAAGVPVVKHGSRAASSTSGTADCLEELGVKLDVAPADQARVLAEAGIVFLFAPLYHPSLRFAAPARRELGIPTSFNFLGPLTNPARPVAQAIGVADTRMAGLMAQVLAERGSRGLVFRGDDGLDELTTTTTSQIWLIQHGVVKQTSFDPAELGIPRAHPSDLVGGDARVNAGVLNRLFDGELGPIRNVVQLNSAAALLAYAGLDLDAELAPQLAPFYQQAGQVIDSGAPKQLLTRWIVATNR